MESLVAETNPVRHLHGQVADWPYGFESAKTNLVENFHHDFYQVVCEVALLLHVIWQDVVTINGRSGNLAI